LWPVLLFDVSTKQTNFFFWLGIDVVFGDASRRERNSREKGRRGKPKKWCFGILPPKKLKKEKFPGSDTRHTPTVLGERAEQKGRDGLKGKKI